MLVAVAAVVLLLVGAALEVWAVIELGWRRAFELSDAPPDPAMAHLVFRGPFRFVRHPQSLGLLLILAGTALAVQAPLMWLLAVIAGGFVVAMAVRDDRELARRFGAAYGRYREAVPLLLPWSAR